MRNNDELQEILPIHRVRGNILDEGFVLITSLQKIRYL
jgi:hypothetical protein